MSSINNSNGSAQVRTALVTGSTRPCGMGYAIARSLAKTYGMNIILHGTRDAKSTDVEKCRSQLANEFNVKVHYIQADLSSTSDTQNLCEEIDQLYPDGLDVLVNNAGITTGAFVENHSLKDWQSILTTNLTAPFILIKHFIPRMKKRGWGRIVNISSGLGIRGNKYSSAYCSSKHGLNGLTKTVGLEAAEFGVTCNAICPGWVETDMYWSVVKAVMKDTGMSEEAVKEEKNNPSKKLVSAEQIGETVSFLCSSAASNTTTAEICIDGGLSA